MAQEKAFQEIKPCLISTPILALYDPNRETKVNADASSHGLGGVVLQNQDDGIWKPVSYVSRALTPTESRYSQIEKECLAFTWACERSSDYLLGKPFIGETDHKPLVPLLTKYPIDMLPPRIQRFKMRLLKFQIQGIIHVPGKYMYTSDVLSRMSGHDKVEASLIPDDDMCVFVDSVIEGLPISDVRLRENKEAQDEDEVCKQIRAYCLEGWPEKHAIPSSIKPYWIERAERVVVRGILMKSTRIVIPSSTRLDVLDRIHEGHFGISKCRERARQAVWWPGLSRQIQDMVEQCRICALNRSNRPEPLNPTRLPDRPWQVTAIDFCKSRKVDYFIMVDYFSKYIEVRSMTSNKKATEVIRVMKSIFSRHGIPEKVRSDNGPPFDSAEYLHFAKQWGFEVGHSSPKFPQSNGEVERAVQTVKRILQKGNEIEMALLVHHATHLACGYSPSELLMGRKLRASLCNFRPLEIWSKINLGLNFVCG